MPWRLAPYGRSLRGTGVGRFGRRRGHHPGPADGNGRLGARRRVAAFFTRGRPGEEEVVEGELEEYRADIDVPGATADFEGVWRTRLRRTLHDDPAAAAELRALLEELTPEGMRRRGDVHNVINGGVQHGTVIQTGSVGSLHIDGQGQGSASTL